jgi:hypothetical protein
LEGGYHVRRYIPTHRSHLTIMQSLEMFVEESAQTLKMALERYTDHLTYVAWRPLHPLLPFDPTLVPPIPPNLIFAPMPEHV